MYRSSLSHSLFGFYLCLLLTACTIHKIDIQQGNVLTQETLNKIVVGMEQNKIRVIAGTPLITDPFRNDRWEYIYTFKDGITKEKQYSYVSLHFEKNILVEVKVHAEPLTQDEINTLHRKKRIERES